MSAIVVDASIALKWVLPEPDSAVAVALLDEWLLRGVRLIAPSWFAGEAANILYRRARQGTFTIRDAHRALTGVLDVVACMPESPVEAHHAMDIANATARAATYDALYLALALNMDGEYWTADEIFYNATKNAYPHVRWMGAYLHQ